MHVHCTMSIVRLPLPHFPPLTFAKQAKLGFFPLFFLCFLYVTKKQTHTQKKFMLFCIPCQLVYRRFFYHVVFGASLHFSRPQKCAYICTCALCRILAGLKVCVHVHLCIVQVPSRSQNPCTSALVQVQVPSRSQYLCTPALVLCASSQQVSKINVCICICALCSFLAGLQNMCARSSKHICVHMQM